MRSLCALLTLVLLGGCRSEPVAPFTPASLVDKLRILAIKAEPPELRPGETSILTALVVDPFGRVRTTSRLWVLCDPSNDSALGSACTNQDTFRSFDAETLPEGVSVMPLPFAFYRAPFDALDELRPDSLERKRGVTASVLLVEWDGDSAETLRDPGTERQMALKRIRIAEAPEIPNRNPQFESLTIDGEPFDTDHVREVKAGSTIELVASATEESRQPFERILPDGSTVMDEEQSVFSWYTLGGEFTEGLSYSSRTASGDPIGLVLPQLGLYPDELIEIWVVLRDARGGTDWIRRRLKLVP